MKSRRIVLKFIKTFTAVLATLCLLIVFFNAYVWVSIKKEESGRLQNSVTQQALGEIANTGSSDLPAILLLHGFGGSPNDLRPLAERIPKDFTFLCPVLPGHGTESPVNLAGVTSGDWERAAISYASALLQDHRDLVVCGFSYGGILALRVASELPVRAVILINPYTSVPYKPYYLMPVSVWQRLGERVTPYVKKIYSGQINSREGRDLYEPSYLHLSVAAYRSMHEHAAAVLENLPDTDGIDVHFHFSENDVVSDPTRVVALASAMNVPDMQLHAWKRSNHVLLFDYDSDMVVERVLQVLDELR